MPKKGCLVIFNVVTLHILIYEGSWTGSWADIMGGYFPGKKHELSPSIYHCKHNCIISNNIIICTESTCDNSACHTVSPCAVTRRAMPPHLPPQVISQPVGNTGKHWSKHRGKGGGDKHQL